MMTLRFLTVSLLVLASVSFVTGQRATAIVREDASSSSVSQQQGETLVHDPSSQRRELTGFWSLFFLLGPGPAHDECGCPKGKLGDPCRHGKGVSDSSECKSNSSDASSTDYTTSSSTSTERNGYDGSDSSSTSNSASSKNDNIPEGAAMLNPNDFSFWMMVAAAVAAAFATGAVVMGQRKRKKAAHPLAGSVARRMGLFSNFADAALCNNSGGGQNRPARVVEMTMSKEDYSMA